MIASVKRQLRRIVPMEYIFHRIYNRNRVARTTSLSGSGSDLVQTAALREALPCLLKELNAGTLLDAPCGDFHWMRQTPLGIDKYIGVDILPELVNENQRAYGSPHIQFLRINIIKDPLPRVDVILCRDCLVHLTSKDVFDVLHNFVRSRSSYLLTTTFCEHEQSPDILRGEWRPLNLELPPFDLGKPLRLINERCSEEANEYRDKALGLWRLDEIGERLRSSRS
jgi:hypothetical protein